MEKTLNNLLEDYLKETPTNNISVKDYVIKRINNIFIEEIKKISQPIRFLKKYKNELNISMFPLLKKSLNINYYFDHIYLLNLERRKDRLDNMIRLFEKNGIYNWSRFNAIDGKTSPHYDEWKTYNEQKLTMLERKKYQRKAISSPGSWAILKSMYYMIKEAINKKHETILVIQDDLIFMNNFKDKFTDAISKVPSNWKLLYLGCTQHNWNHIGMQNGYYNTVGNSDGAYAVAIHNSIFKEMLDEIVKFDLPFDSGTLKTIQRRHKNCYSIYPYLVIADIRDSDLRNPRDIIKYSKKFKWNLELYDI